MEYNKKKVLFIDLDGTLIKTASGNTFPVSINDYTFRNEVLDKIGKMFPKLEYVYIVTNQGGIPKYVSKEDFETKLEGVTVFVRFYLTALKVKVDSIYCDSVDKDNPMRKPNTGMLEHFWSKELSKENAIMIGDASGKEGQFSDSDKKTAENYHIDYIDVEDFINTNWED